MLSAKRETEPIANLTGPPGVPDMMWEIHSAFGKLDVLVLNASGGPGGLSFLRWLAEIASFSSSVARRPLSRKAQQF
jgi:hypothetical protein